jgi:hypothetical protein
MSDVSTVAVKPRDSTLTRRNLIIAERIGIATFFVRAEGPAGSEGHCAEQEGQLPCWFRNLSTKGHRKWLAVFIERVYRAGRNDLTGSMSCQVDSIRETG